MLHRPSTALAAGLTIASVLAMAPLSVEVAAPADDCADTVGRELLTVDGLDVTFQPPVVTAPELSATADVTGEAITPHRSAHFTFTVDAAPYDEVELTATLSWADTPSDYDLYGYQYFDDFRFPLATSNESNIDGGDTRQEAFTVTVEDCAKIDLEARAWAGHSAQDLTLTVEVTPVGEPAEGVLPRVDDRRQLFLTGDRPGNLATPKGTVGADHPFDSGFTADRPTGGTPNLITRPVVGSAIETNSFQPWWAGQLDDFPLVQGAPTALVWLSSPTEQQDPGTVSVQLFLNGTEHVVEIPGDQLTSDVQPFFVTFPEVDTQVFQFSLQVSTLPIASPNASSEHLGDANHTVFYDSVQYQSRLFLPIAPTTEAVG